MDNEDFFIDNCDDKVSMEIFNNTNYNLLMDLFDKFFIDLCNKFYR